MRWQTTNERKAKNAGKLRSKLVIKGTFSDVLISRFQEKGNENKDTRNKNVTKQTLNFMRDSHELSQMWSLTHSFEDYINCWTQKEVLLKSLKDCLQKVLYKTPFKFLGEDKFWMFNFRRNSKEDEMENWTNLLPWRKSSTLGKEDRMIPILDPSGTFMGKYVLEKLTAAQSLFSKPQLKTLLKDKYSKVGEGFPLDNVP